MVFDLPRLEAFLARGESEQAADAEVLLYRFRHNQGRTDEARAHLEHARALVEEAPPSRAKAEVLSNTARFLMLSGEEAEAIRVSLETLDMALDLGLDEVRAQALGSIGIARVNAGDPGGLVDLESSIELAGAIGSPESVRGLRTLGAAYSGRPRALLSLPRGEPACGTPLRRRLRTALAGGSAHERAVLDRPLGRGDRGGNGVHRRFAHRNPALHGRALPLQSRADPPGPRRRRRWSRA